MASWWISAGLALLSLQVSLSHAFAGCKLDVGFLIDGSGSIGRSGFLQEIGFVKNMVSQLDVSSASSHVSVMTFESSARIVNYFNEISGYSKQHLFAKMNSIPYRGGGTNTEAALNLARTAMFTSSRGARAKCNKVLVVFTDGRSASGVSRVNTAAEKLKDMGTKIISIGVGRSISSSELHAMASSRSHVFTVSSAYALNHILSKVKSELCRETTCWQVNCEYAVWSSWSSSCGQAKRQRALKKRSFAMKKVMGGCAAYSSSCPDTAEAKNLGTCPVCKLDIGFLLDESGSIGRSGFRQELHFVKNIATQLAVSSSNTHVSVMTFSSNAIMRNYFRDASSQSQYHLERLVNSIRYRGGGTDTERALNLARTAMFQQSYGARTGINKILLVFTDGRSASGVTRVRAAAQKLQDMGINIISIGVGSSIDVNELNGMASGPISAHVFRVSSASLLSSIVSKVKEESCKAVTCTYAECTYSQWGAWSRTCGDATRQRRQSKITMKTKQAVGGCAGLSKTCHKTQEQKNLGVCLQNCRYAECSWGSWGSWSASCGYGVRSRKIVTTLKYVKRASCYGLTLQCRSNTQHNVRNTYCVCNYVECYWGSWGAWSTTCGYGKRSREIASRKKTVNRNSCSGLQQTCSSNKQYSARNQLCSCPYVACSWGSWGAWSTTCGDGVRSRKYVATKRTISRTGCSGLPQACSSRPHQTSRRIYCSCPYVRCSWGSWSSWSTSCGQGVRARKQVPYKRTVNRINCSGLPQTCSSTPQGSKRTSNCKCNYVECKTGSWGSWNTPCGKGSRTRTIQTVRKTVYKLDCAGLATNCASLQTSESRATLCTCSIVECNYGPWSSWTTSCGAGERARKMIATLKTVKKASCSGLPKTCSKATDVDKRTELCTCNYVECNYGPWSSWTTSCGAGERARKMIATPKTVKKASCSGLPKTCSKATDVDQRTELCTCNYVECNYGPWSSWTTSCGAGERARKMIVTPKTVQKASCSGLSKTCSTAIDVDKRTELCTCNYVECNYGPWSSWNTSCGAGERARKMIATSKTVQKASCSGLPKTCSTAMDVDKRTELCTCNYVECNYGPWSSWTTSCGAGERARKMIATPKTVQKASCSGLPKTCSTAKDVDKRTKLCTCNYVECNYGPWSSWTTSCGAGERARKMIATSKTVQKASCSGLLKTCSTAMDVDKRTELCTCKYVECNYGPWSSWTTSCGAGERARKMIATPKTVQKASCSGLLKTCSTAMDVDKRTELCTCNYVECNYGPWSSWTTSCGAGERARKMIATSKTVEKANCSGLLKTCSTAMDVDKRTELCTCKYVECNYGPWSSWTTSCGAGERARKMIATPKTVKKASCSGLPKTCSTAMDVDKRTELCTCNYVECNYGPWSSWTTSCGAGERARKMIATSKTVEKASCSGLLKTCSTAMDVDKRTELCTCKYVECNYGPWSSWTTSCGAGERARKMIATPKTVQKASCSGLLKTCSTAMDVDKRTELCTCNYVECNYGPWSSWNTSCGAGERARKMIATPKTAQNESCSGFPKTCSTAVDVDKRTKLCQCQTVRCQPSEWTQWSATCGHARRTVRIITIPVTVERQSCDQLPTKCENSQEVQQVNKDKCKQQGRDTNCTVNFKSLGCFKDDMKSPRPMAEMLFTERDRTDPAWNGNEVDWENWDTYRMKLICRCAEKARSKKYVFFGLQFFGECWSGPEAGGTYMRNGPREPGKCLKEKYAPCVAGDKHCIGTKETNFVYQITT